MNDSAYWAVFHAQVKTFTCAKKLAGDYRQVTEVDAWTRPPFCLRIGKAYRSPKVQAFRDAVARQVKQDRKGERACIHVIK